MAARTTQLATIAVSAPQPPPAQVTQLASIVVGAPIGPPAQITQLAVIQVTAFGKAYLQLGPSIPLNCWQPCTAYATPSTIVYLG